MICQTCNLNLRYDRHINALYCVDCDYVLFLPKPVKRRVMRKGRVGAVSSKVPQTPANRRKRQFLAPVGRRPTLPV